MHLDRHINKTDKELIIRMLNDWKLFSSCMNINVEHKFDRDGVYTIHNNDIIGFGYNRRYEKVITYSYKVVVKDSNVITIYPDLECGINTGEYFDFSCINYNTNLWKMFTDVVYDVDCEVRYIDKKNPQVRVYFDNFVLKINKKFEGVLVEDINGYVHKESTVEGEFRNADDIKNFIEKIRKRKALGFTLFVIYYFS